MAAAVFEVLDREPRWRDVDVVVAPGHLRRCWPPPPEAAAPARPRLLCVISLSDILKPWSIVERRLNAAAGADLVVVIYNPASSRGGRGSYRARKTCSSKRGSPARPRSSPATSAEARRGLVRVIALHRDLAAADVDMRTLVIVRIEPDPSWCHAPDGESWVYTPRHYPDPTGDPDRSARAVSRPAARRWPTPHPGSALRRAGVPVQRVSRASHKARS